MRNEDKRARVEFGIDIVEKTTSQPWMRQIHGDCLIEAITQSPSSPLPEADAIWTRIPACISVSTADCLPLLVYSTESPVVAAAHCGWRGALAGLGRKTLKRVQGETPNQKAIRAVIGPAIGSCCFEVRRDFVDAFRAKQISPEPFLSLREERLYFDLVKYVLEVELTGVSRDQVDLSMHRCTYCSEPRLPSYRRNGNTDTCLRTWIRRKT